MQLHPRHGMIYSPYLRDDHVIDTCDKYGIAMAFTHVRLFHH